MRDRFAEIADAAEPGTAVPTAAFLAELLLAECDDRDARRAARRVHDAGFPRTKTLADFDFNANPRSTPPPSTPSPAAAGSATASRCA